MSNFESVWSRIRSYAGEEFWTKTGQPFTYEVPGKYVRVTREGREINRSLSRTNFETAAAQMPASGPAAIRARQGSAYTYGILMDPRIRAGDW